MRLQFLISIFALFLIVGCSPQSVDESDGAIDDSGSEAIISWRSAQLKDVNSGEIFAIDDFKGEKILLESFAVWCPTCTRQQKIIKQLHEEIGDSVVSISLDTDPNEDEALVRDHTEANGFTWRYAVAPSHVTRSLIDEFGVGIVDAPAVPMVLVCEDQSARFLPRGLKSVEELKEEIGKGC